MLDIGGNPEQYRAPNRCSTERKGTVIKALSETEAAGLLGLTVKTLATWRSKGLGPPYRKIGRRVEYTDTDFDEWRQAQRCDPAEAAAARRERREVQANEAEMSLQRGVSRRRRAPEPSSRRSA